MGTPRWLEGTTDAIGFVGGALTGFGLGRVLGFDVFAPGYGTAAIVGIVLVGLGGGAGLQLARAVLMSRRRRDASARDGGQ